jgi:hypothetical protein
MNSRKKIVALSAAVMAAVATHRATASTITEWTWTAKVGAPDNSPAPATGAGTAVSLGMTNTYTYSGGELGPSVTNDDITQPGSKGQLTDFTWRIRGNSNAAGPGANGWNNSAPDYSQGAEFEVSTAGYMNIGLNFDWYSTTQGVGNMQVQYTLDDTQATPTWVNLGSDLVANSNNFYAVPPATPTSPTNTFDFSSIPGVSNDPNFAVQLVSVRPVPGDANWVAGASNPGELANGNDGNYAGAAGGDYNNSSGNWSFGNITFTGTAVPEPASVSLLGLAGMALLNRRRGRSAK